MDERKKSTKQAEMGIFVIGQILILYLSLHYGYVCAHGGGSNYIEDTMNAFVHMTSSPFDLQKAFQGGKWFIFLFCVSCIYWMCVALYETKAQLNSHADSKTAQGSSDWNTNLKGYSEQFEIKQKNKDAPDKNLILGKGLKYGLKVGRNVNVVIMGSAGSGKSFGVIKPNLLQMNSSYVVTDPSGEIFRSMAQMLIDNGYNVKLFSTSNMENSNCYNPFDYVYDEEGKVDETRVTSMIKMFMDNAAGAQQNKGDQFWTKSSQAFLTACAMLLLEFYPPETHNMYEMLKLAQKGKVSESKSEEETELDRMFAAARKINPEAHCFSSYDTFKLAPARTANSILISAAVDLNMFNQTKVRNMTTTSYKVRERNTGGQIRSFALGANHQLIRTDENIDLRTVGDEKTAIFVNIPQADGTFNFLVSMMYSQLFESLYSRAEKTCPKKWMACDHIGDPIFSMVNTKEDAEKLKELYSHAEIRRTKEDGKDVFYLYNKKAGAKYTHPGYANGMMKRFGSEKAANKFVELCKDAKIQRGNARLPWHVQCLLDEFSNIGEIPEFPQKLATMRKYEISCVIVLQSLAQLKNRYDKLYADILSNCDNTIFLGTSDPETCEYISKRLGPKTIKIKSNGTSNSGKGTSTSSNMSLQKRELLTPDEVSRINGNESIVLTAGQKPFLIRKYRAIDHPNWKLSGDDNKDFAIEPTDFTKCAEKAFSAAGEAQQLAKELTQAAAGRNDQGEAVGKKTEIHNGAQMKRVLRAKQSIDTSTQGKSVPNADLSRRQIKANKPQVATEVMDNIPIPGMGKYNKKEAS